MGLWEALRGIMHAKPFCLGLYLSSALLVAHPHNVNAQVPLSPIETGLPIEPAYNSDIPPAALETLSSTPLMPMPAVAAATSTKDEVNYPTVRLKGILQLDAVYDIQSVRNRQIVGDVNSSLGFRRARLAAVGNLSENITYQTEFDFAASQPTFVDNWVTFGKLPGVGNIRLGRYRQPFGMAELTSITEIPFLERPTPLLLAPFRQTGIMAFDAVANDRITYAVSGYRYNSDQFGNISGDAGGYGFATRITGIPILWNDNHLVHIGADYSLNDPDEPNQLRLQNVPEVFAGNVTGSLLNSTLFTIPPFVDTGVVTVGQNHHFNLEAAYVRNNFALQGEARALVLDQVDGDTETLPGFYAHTRYVLTGENIPYDKKNAVFTRVKPRCGVDKGGMGAWEVAFRWSFVDLDGTNGMIGTGADAVPGPGRKLNNLTLGLNWYLIDNARFQFNYIHSILDDSRFGVTSTDFLALRCQIDF